MVIEVCATWLHASADAAERKQPGCTGQPKPRNENKQLARAAQKRNEDISKQADPLSLLLLIFIRIYLDSFPNICMRPNYSLPLAPDRTE